jgi:hypothetical protein
LSAGAAAGEAAAAAEAAEDEETDGGADAAVLAVGGACAGGPEVVVREARQRVGDDKETARLPRRAVAVRTAASMARASETKKLRLLWG